MSAVIIPARYASSRFPGKMLAKLGSETMIARVVKQCLLSKAASVHIVTDDERIIGAVKHLNVKTHMSPADLPTGSDRIAYVAKNLPENIIINVQGDEPFIAPELINELIEQLESEPALKMNSACVEFSAGDDPLSPAHVKVVMDKDGYALYFSRSLIPYDRDGVKPIRYKHIGIYGFRRDFLLRYTTMPKTALESAEMLEQLRVLESGERIKMVKTSYKPLSIDTIEDLKAAEAYLAANLQK